MNVPSYTLSRPFARLRCGFPPPLRAEGSRSVHPVCFRISRCGDPISEVRGCSRPRTVAGEEGGVVGQTPGREAGSPACNPAFSHGFGLSLRPLVRPPGAGPDYWMGSSPVVSERSALLQCPSCGFAADCLACYAQAGGSRNSPGAPSQLTPRGGQDRPKCRRSRVTSGR